jgi:hypothetical protein
MLRQIFGVTAILLAFGACSSRSSLGEGNGGINGTGGGAGYEPCAGKACGSECSACPPNDPTCAETAVLKYCAADGSCGQAYPVCDPTSCTSDSECASDLGPCQQCPDGTLACPYAKCEAGQCVGGFDSCGGQTCDSNDDCPAIGAPCQQCPDGTVACPFSECVNGQCGGGFDGCGGFDPCAGKACGDACSQCPPDDPDCVETSVLKYCDSSGQCGAAYPLCENTCKTDADCGPVDLICKPCADGTCATVTCNAGQCGWSCPPVSPPECQVKTDCAAIELCKVCADGTCAEIDCVNGACEFVCQ